MIPFIFMNGVIPVGCRSLFCAHTIGNSFAGLGVGQVSRNGNHLSPQLAANGRLNPSLVVGSVNNLVKEPLSFFKKRRKDMQHHKNFF